MTDYKVMTMDELHERLLETREFQRITRIQRDALDDQVISLGFACDDILNEIQERRVPLRIIGGCGG